MTETIELSMEECERIICARWESLSELSKEVLTIAGIAQSGSEIKVLSLQDYNVQVSVIDHKETFINYSLLISPPQTCPRGVVRPSIRASRDPFPLRAKASTENKSREQPVTWIQIPPGAFLILT